MYIQEIIENPDYILEDNKNIDTVLYMKNIKRNNKNIQIVIRLNTNKTEINKKNSILTLLIFTLLAKTDAPNIIANTRVINIIFLTEIDALSSIFINYLIPPYATFFIILLFLKYVKFFYLYYMLLVLNLC